MKYRIASSSLVAVLAISAQLSAQEQEVKAPQPSTYSVLYTFTGGADGAAPLGGDLILDPEGNLYGTTTLGGDLSCPDVNPPGCGVVFKLDRTGKQSALHTFTGGEDGKAPFQGVVRDAEGNLYGTANSGGSYGAGVVFKVDKVGDETILYTFTGGADGGCPYGLLRDDTGNIFGAAECGGADGAGAVFKVDRAGNESVLYSFTGGVDGAYPNNLTQDAQGNFVATAYAGGNLSDCGGRGCGVVFKLDRAGKETVLYAFTGGADGGTPYANVVPDETGNLYGTAYAGGDLGSTSPICGGGGFGCGVVFKVDRTGKETVLYTFTGGADGALPVADLIRDDDGNLYSTTPYGGKLGCDGGSAPCGVVFKVDRGGKETVLYSFTGGVDGANPEGGLLRTADGNLYGTTSYGGDIGSSSSCTTGYGCGVVFKIKLPDQCKEDRK
jgi:uncharacterized repeat protein (TIGR03803 family)